MNEIRRITILGWLIAAGCSCALASGCDKRSPSGDEPTPPASSAAPNALVPIEDPDASTSEPSAIPGSQDQAASPQRPAPARSWPGEYAALLSEVVTDHGLVRYDLLAEDSRRARLERVVRQFAETASPVQDTERLALWCNAYNANVLLLALNESRKPEFKSVKVVPGFFDAQAITVAGEQLTLTGLETNLRALGDPRVHATLVRAASSCPPLRREPYDSNRLDEQLNDQCRRWLEDRRKNRVSHHGLAVSEIFQWHEVDFNVEPYGGVIGFLRKHAHPGGSIRDFIRNVKPVRIEYISYDWRLNQAPLDNGSERP